MARGAEGTTLPPVVEIARRHGVAAGTAHRAIVLLTTCGLIDVSRRGRRAVVKAYPERHPAHNRGIQ